MLELVLFHAMLLPSPGWSGTTALCTTRPHFPLFSTLAFTHADTTRDGVGGCARKNMACTALGCRLLLVFVSLLATSPGRGTAEGERLALAPYAGDA